MAYNRGPTAGDFEMRENEDERDEKVVAHKNKGVKETDAAGDKASGNTRGLEQEQHGTDKGYLDPNAGKNIAKGQGTYDMINNRDYGTTLRLAREADAYNNRRQEHYMDQSHWKAGGNRDMGTLAERPKIETMETRAMDQSFNLDTNQKQLAQSLQDAVNHKDLDAFQQLYKQLYGIELDKMTAEIEMTKMARQQLWTDQIQRNYNEWAAYFKRACDAQTAATIAAAMRTDTALAGTLAALLGNGVAIMSQSDAVQTKYMNDLTNQFSKYTDPATAARMSQTFMNDLNAQFDISDTMRARQNDSIIGGNKAKMYFNRDMVYDTYGNIPGFTKPTW